MKKINLGENLDIDIEKLLESRLLIQANSGGGKSYLLRKLLEESHSSVQQIVFDLEGEFSTLREKYDYLLVAKDGDIPITIKSASLLPKKILETEVSTIIDLSELKSHERLLYVKRFLDTIINLPKKYWKPVLVVIDEAHVFAPEKGKSESAGSVIDLATRGRKRGFCICLATQRLSKLSKDAVAECNNKLIGRTGLDIDMKRVSDELGFTSKQDMLKLRQLEAGEFFAFGTAISNEIIKAKIGLVNTSHPKVGGRIIKDLTATPQKIKKLAESFGDLDIKAEVEFNEIEDYKKEIKTLRQKVTLLNNQDKNKEWEKAYQIGYAKALKESKPVTNQPVSTSEAEDKLRKIEEILSIGGRVQPKQVVESKAISSNDLGRCPKKIYTLLFQNPHKSFSKVQIGFLTGYSHKSGGFNNAISELNSLGLIEKQGSLIGLGKNDVSLVGNEDVKLSLELWFRKLGKCPSEILKVLLDNPQRKYSKEELGEITGYSYTSGGFNNAISQLNSQELIRKYGQLIQLHEDVDKIRGYVNEQQQ